MGNVALGLVAQQRMVRAGKKRWVPAFAGMTDAVRFRRRAGDKPRSLEQKLSATVAALVE